MSNTPENNARTISAMMRNISDNISLMSFADRAFMDLLKINLFQQRLAARAANGQNNETQLKNFNNETNSLVDTFNNVIQNTRQNGTQLIKSFGDSNSILRNKSEDEEFNFVLDESLDRILGITPPKVKNVDEIDYGMGLIGYSDEELVDTRNPEFWYSHNLVSDRESAEVSEADSVVSADSISISLLIAAAAEKVSNVPYVDICHPSGAMAALNGFVSIANRIVLEQRKLADIKSRILNLMNSQSIIRANYVNDGLRIGTAESATDAARETCELIRISQSIALPAQANQRSGALLY